MRLVNSVPFTAVHRVKTGAFYQVFGNGHNLDVCVGVLKGHGFLSVLNLLDKSFKFCVSADLALHSLVDFVDFLACESPIFTVEVSYQSEACYSCVCCVFFLECAVIHFRSTCRRRSEERLHVERSTCRRRSEERRLHVEDPFYM